MAFDDEIVELFFYIIQKEIKGECINIAPLSNQTLAQLFKLSVKHDLSHLMGDVLIRNNLIPDDSPFKQKFRLEFKYRVTIVINIEHEIEQICKVFDNAKIQYVVLKGARLRSLYPESWMRTSCDIDILIHEDELDYAIEKLNQIGYKVDGKKNFHDIHLYSEIGLHLELHFNIKENIEPMDSVLDKIWNNVQPIKNSMYYETPEYFMFHHIAHMAYHFSSGGCGIRPFIDLWILKQKFFYNECKYLEFLKEAKLEKFEKYAIQLMQYWFESGNENAVIRDMQQYIINGGSFGTKEQKMVIKQSKSGSKINYLLKRLFMPYKDMMILYPVLEKHKRLLPIFEIHRWFKIIKHRDRIMDETKIAINSQVDYSVEMMKKLGL